MTDAHGVVSLCVASRSSDTFVVTLSNVAPTLANKQLFVLSLIS